MLRMHDCLMEVKGATSVAYPLIDSNGSVEAVGSGKCGSGIDWLTFVRDIKDFAFACAICGTPLSTLSR